MIASLFHPRSAPLELTGASRVVVEISSHHRRLASMSFSCSRENLAGYTQSNFSEALEIAFRLAISFRRSVLFHALNKAWSKQNDAPKFTVSGA